MIKLFLSPLFGGIVATLLLWLGRRLWPAWLRVLLWLALLCCYLLITPLVSNLLLGTLQSRAHAPCPMQPAAVVVLGGGGRSKAGVRDYVSLSLASLRRVMTGVAVWKKQPRGTFLVFSGGSAHAGQAESPRMAALARQMGVPEAAIRIETHSRTTWQNAHNLARLAPPVPRSMWLVTSAVHMPRARYSMQLAGFRVCSAPVESRGRRLRWYSMLLPDSGALNNSEAVLHEWVGLAWYHLKGW